ncbi:MAG: hypothetical protein AAF439_08425 [Pseudomonadota bacterium]
MKSLRKSPGTLPTNRTLAAVLGAGLLLAGCGGSSEEPTAETQPTPAPAQQTQTAQAASNQVQVLNCTGPTNGSVHFRVGRADLAIPGNLVLDAVPAGMQPPITRESVQAELQARAAQGAGCPGKPIDAGLVLIRDQPQHPLLDGQIGLLRMPPEGITARFAEVTRNLQTSPTRNCQTMGADLIGCVGKENRGGEETDVMYVITTDPSEKMRSGGPLSARCVLKDKAVERCNLIDQLSGNLAIDANLKAGSYSTAGLRAALDIATAKVNGLRL